MMKVTDEAGATDRKFNLGDRVTKTKGSSWTGRVVGFYSTSLTPIGYAIESENEPGSVQIYPESALVGFVTEQELLDGINALASHDPAPTDTQDPAFDFYAHLKRQREWSEETFGPGPRTLGVIDHIRKELREIEENPHDISEWIDVAILALDGAWRAGYQPQEIIDALIAKQTKNEGRQWPDWRSMPTDKAIEHDRSTDTQEALSEAGEVVAYLMEGSTVTWLQSTSGLAECDKQSVTPVPLVRQSALTACRDECFKRLQEAERLSYELTACQQEVERLRDLLDRTIPETMEYDAESGGFYDTELTHDIRAALGGLSSS